MEFTREQLYKFGHFHKAVLALSRDGKEPELDQVFAEAAALAPEQLEFCVSNRLALEEAARSAGLIE